MNFDNIPKELIQQNSWICWRAELNPSTDKVDKVPINALTGSRASSTNQQTWAPFRVAREYYLSHTDISGVGFVFTPEDPYTGIDLDDCIKPNLKRPRIESYDDIQDWAIEIIEIFNTYTEVSPSGHGVKLWIKNSGLDKGRRNDEYHGGGVEIYSKSRYFTVTGDRLDSLHETIVTIDSETFYRFFELVFDTPDPENPSDEPTPGNEPPPINHSDQEIIRKAKNCRVNGEKFRKLWDGDISDYSRLDESTGIRVPDHSRADCALCALLAFWTHKDHATIDRLFRRSGLWREKWDREDYRQSTIERACRNIPNYNPDHYKDQQSEQPQDEQPQNGNQGSQEQHDDPEIDDTPYSDAFNANAFVKKHGESFVWVDSMKEWLFWNGRYWQIDTTKQIESTMESVVMDLMNTSGQRLSKSDYSARLSHVKSSLNSNRIKAGVEMLKHRLSKDPTDFDSQGHYLNCKNGTIDLRTGEIKPHQSTDFLMKYTDVTYKGIEFVHDDWIGFLEDVQPEKDMRDYLQRASGYTASNSVANDCLFYLYGQGSNGKTTFINAIETCLGTYAGAAPRAMMQQKKFEGDSAKTDYEIADLYGMRMSVCSEVAQGAKMAESLIKDLTGGDERKGRHPYGRYFAYQPSDKFWLYGNHLLEVTGTDQGIWRRIRLIKFNEQFKNPDTTLRDRIKNDPEIQSAVLSWIVGGATQWYDNHRLNEPEGVIKDTQEYREEMDDVSTFIDEYCLLTDHDKYTPFADLWDAYSTQFEGTTSKRAFSKELTTRGHNVAQKRIHGKVKKVRTGIVLREVTSEQPENEENSRSKGYSNTVDKNKVTPSENETTTGFEGNNKEESNHVTDNPKTFPRENCVEKVPGLEVTTVTGYRENESIFRYHNHESMMIFLQKWNDGSRQQDDTSLMDLARENMVDLTITPYGENGGSAYTTMRILLDFLRSNSPIEGYSIFELDHGWWEIEFTRGV